MRRHALPAWTAIQLSMLAALVFLTSQARAEWPTEGGDSGQEITVTTLDDAGPGSLRSALSEGGKRRVVFAIAGEIFLKKPLIVKSPFVTIAGETAPAPGITLLGDKLRIRTHDVIVRDLRIRVGELPGPNASNRDGISIDRSGSYEVENILIDHCSIAWAVDEGLALWGKGIANVLVRDSIIAETLSSSIHEKGPHSMGLLVGEGAHDVVVQRNLLADNMFRNPLIDAGASAVVVNNLIYNPGWSGFHVYEKPGAGPTLVSVVGNVLIAGPDSRPRKRFRSFDKGIDPGSQVYYSDNLAIGREAFSKEERAGKESTEPVSFVEHPPIWFDWITPLSSDAVEAAVLAHVGARPDDRDETDRRIVEEVTSRTGSVKDTPVDERLRAKRPLSGGGN